MATAEQRQWIPLQKQLVPKTKGDSAAGQYQRNARRRHREAIEYALRKGHLKLLDSELILASQLESEGAGAALELRDVLRISLGGSHVQALDDIAVLSCARLRLCCLESCYLSDISAFYGCVNLLRLDVSNNQVATSLCGTCMAATIKPCTSEHTGIAAISPSRSTVECAVEWVMGYSLCEYVVKVYAKCVPRP